MKKAFFVTMLILLAAAAVLGLRSASRKTRIFGNEVFSEEAYLSFLGDEFSSLEQVKKALRPFKNLKKADLGTFAVDVTLSESLTEEFPGVEFKYDTAAFMYGGKFNTDVTEIDLSQVTVENTDELRRLLPYFKKVKKVTLGNNALPESERVSLCKEFPKTDFNIISIYDVLGLPVREDAVSIDLRGAALDISVLSEKLPLFKKLETVDLREQSIPKDTQLSLVKQFPTIEFICTVDFLGEKINSTATEIDISNKYMPGRVEEMKELLPLFKRLEKLVMCDCSLSNEEMAQIRAQCEGIKVVWRIYMGKWSLRTDTVAFSVLIYTYNYRPLTTSDIQVLKYCTDLRALDLGHQAITDISVIGEYLTELRLLILADNMLTDLSPLSKLEHLHYLEFFVNNVTDLSPLAECTQLMDLNISYNHNIRDITPLLNLPKLERLWLESTAVHAEDVQLLRTTYPDAKIVSVGRGSIDQGWRTHERYYAMMDMWLNHPDSISEEFTKYD